MVDVAAIVVENQADSGTLTASSEELSMPASQIQTAHPSERWRSLSNTADVILDKGSLRSADTVFIGGLTCGANSTARVRLSTVDTSGAAGDIYDSGTISDGSMAFDVDYSSIVVRLPAPASWRYLRVDLTDPDADYVEIGCIVDGLSEAFDYNFVAGSTSQWNDRSRVEKASSGKTLTWPDNKFRSIALSFNLVSDAQRYGVVETLDRVNGLTENVLLITDIASDNMPRSSIFGLVSEVAPNTFGPIFTLFGKQLKIEERV